MPAFKLILAACALGFATSTAHAGNVFFGPLVSSVGPFGDGLTIGDFDGDGISDAAVLDWAQNRVITLRGRGDGAFGAPVVRASVQNMFDLRAGDVNGNSLSDLLVVDFEGRLHVLLADPGGSGGFSPMAPHTVGRTFAVAIGDMNEDGKSDVVLNRGSSIQIALGRGDGTFLPPSASYPAATNVGPLVVWDLNLDGKLDVLTTDVGDDEVVTLLGNGDGTLQPARSFDGGFGVDTTSPFVGDFNGDGVPDVTTASGLHNYVHVHLGDGAGGFPRADSLFLGGDPRSVIAGDFNLDGDDDLVVLDSRTHEVKFLAGHGDGTFADPDIYLASPGPIGSWSRYLVTADFNLDGLPDFAVLGSRGELSVFLNAIPEPGAAVLLLAVVSITAALRRPPKLHQRSRRLVRRAPLTSARRAIGWPA